MLRVISTSGSLRLAGCATSVMRGLRIVGWPLVPRTRHFMRSARGLGCLAVDLRVHPHVVQGSGDDGQRGVGEGLAADVAVVGEVAALERRQDADDQPDDDESAAYACTS